MSSPNLAQWKRWERTRSLGRTQFVWLNGVCFFGLLFGCGMAGFIFLQNWGTNSPGPNQWPMMFFGLLVGPPTGYVWGRWTWSLVEAKYLAAVSDQRQRDTIDEMAREICELREEQKQSKREHE